MTRPRFLFLLPLSLVATLSGEVAAVEASKIAPELNAVPAGTRVNVIVRYKNSVSSTDVSKLESTGGLSTKVLSNVKMTSLSMPVESAKALKDSSNFWTATATSTISTPRRRRRFPGICRTEIGTAT